jgi:MFS family permease
MPAAGSIPEGRRKATFWTIAAMLPLLLASAAIPSPLYRVYQSQWGFSASTLSVIFGVYVATLLVTLLIFGKLSDFLGRRPIIIVGLLFDVAACIVFLLAGGVGSLLLARALQGVAVGIGAGPIGAALLDLEPKGGLAPLVTSNGPSVGLATGGLFSAIMVQYAPLRTHLVWWVLLVACLVAIVAVLRAPETGTLRAGVRSSLRPNVKVPPHSRSAFLVAVPSLLGCWALSGYYFSLGPSLVALELETSNLIWGGLSIFVLGAAGVTGCLYLRRNPPEKIMFVGCCFLVIGAAATAFALIAGSPVLLFVGTALAGLGFGPSYLGAFQLVVSTALPDDRAGLIAAVYVVSYIGFGGPAVAAGFASRHWGLHGTSIVYLFGIAALAALAGASVWAHRRAGRGVPASSVPWPCPGPGTVPPAHDGVAPGAPALGNVG